MALEISMHANGPWIYKVIVGKKFDTPVPLVIWNKP